MRRVLLTDSLSEVVETMAEMLEDHFRVLICHNPEELASAVEQFDPELMVLDVSMPGCDLVCLQKLFMSRNIQIIATTCVVNDYLQDYLQQINARWMIVKPFLPYVIVSRLLELELRLDEPPDMELRSCVYDLLLRVGAQLSHSGFRIVAEGVLFACNHENFSMTSELYPHVAQLCGGTEDSVEIAMRRCIDATFKRCAPYNRRFILNLSDISKCPTNAEFLKQIATKARKATYSQ